MFCKIYEHPDYGQMLVQKAGPAEGGEASILLTASIPAENAYAYLTFEYESREDMESDFELTFTHEFTGQMMDEYLVSTGRVKPTIN